MILTDIVKNVAMGIPAIRARRLKSTRTASAPTPEGLAHHVDILRDAVAATGPIQGKSVLEIGPGDNLVTGLAFLAAGARSYTAVDRFPGDYRSVEALTWYAALKARDGAIPSIDDPRITVHAGAVETIGDVGRFDIVCSHAVGEHVTSVPAFARFTRDSLAPDGRAVHIVDFSGHHWHRDDDPDAFRRIPEWLWRAMGSNRGLPNRVPPDAFERALLDTGLDVSMTIDGTHALFTPRTACVL